MHQRYSHDICSFIMFTESGFLPISCTKAANHDVEGPLSTKCRDGEGDSGRRRIGFSEKCLLLCVTLMIKPGRTQTATSGTEDEITGALIGGLQSQTEE